MIVAANPLAAQAGFDILAEGGSAIDAAIAAQMVLNLVEPQSSGIGGGGFLLHWDAKTKNLQSYDGRETAPLAAKPTRFLNPDGTPMKFRAASFGGLSVGAPGLLRMLEKAHRSHGKLPWKRLFSRAIVLATTGFQLSPRLHSLLSDAKPDSFGPEARDYFYDEHGAPWPVGHILKNPKLAATFEEISDKGADAFYSGTIADAIVAKTASDIGKKGDLTTEDLKTYEAKERPPVCQSYRQYIICGMGPPSSGALTIAQTMTLLEAFDLGKEPLNPGALHLIAEAEKLAFADRKRYMADPDFVSVPTGLLDTAYLAKRRKLIDTTKAMEKAEPGSPPLSKKSSYGRDSTVENKGTTHLSIVDAQGNAIALTSSIESAFGANIMTSGFLLNNELTDFSFLPEDKDGTPIANRVEPGKRPRSSMSPTMVFGPDGRLIMITGSPGGSRIIPYVIKTLVAHLDWDLNAAEAAALPNFGSRRGPFEIEPDALPPESLKHLESLGHNIRTSPMTSGSHIIIRSKDGLEGGADPRREGVALGK